MIRTTLLSLALLLTTINFSTAAERVSAEPGKPHVYKTANGKELVMEIYFPKNWSPDQKKVPGVIMFHGGGWGGGSPSQFRYACNYFASRGLVAATVQYTLADKKIALPPGQSRKRVCIVDAKSAIRWFKQNANKLGIDSNKIITGGGSAGGHICLLATTTPELNDPNDPKEIDTSVAAYLLFNPALSSSDSKDSAIDFLQHLSADFAPAVIFFGDKDKWKQGWDTAHNKLAKLGNKSIDLQIAPGKGHAFFNQQPWADLTIAAADRFLVNQGFLEGKPTLAKPDTGEKLIKNK